MKVVYQEATCPLTGVIVARFRVLPGRCDQKRGSDMRCCFAARFRTWRMSARWTIGCSLARRASGRAMDGVVARARFP